MTIRPATAADADAIWRIFQSVVAGGDTYVFAPDTPRDEALDYFLVPLPRGTSPHLGTSLHRPAPPRTSLTPIPTHPTSPTRSSSWVADLDGKVVGMYKLIPNRRDLGSHVANASFMVDPSAHGRGIGRALGEHCLAEAKRDGYHAMQFNFVVSTNAGAVHLWQSLGFTILATLPKAFRHSRLGLVDAYVMHRFL